MNAEALIVTVPRIGYRLVTTANSEESRASGRPSIAVLPFANLSSSIEQDYLADGVVEDLITALSRFKTFAVAARTSSFAYKGRSVDARAAALELGVRYLLEGSVRRSGDKMRVTAQLIDGASGAHLWAETFDGAVTDIFDFQDRITRSAIGLIEPQIRRAEIDRSRRKRPESLDAWDLYVQALPLVYSTSATNHSTAIVLLDRAIAIDPSYAPALALGAWAREKRKTVGGAEPPGADDAKISFALAERALEADPDDPVVIALMGWLRMLFRRDFSGLQLCMRAVALNPNNLLVLNWATVSNLFGGDLDDAIAFATRAVELSPMSPDTYVCLNDIAWGHMLAGRFEVSLEWARRTLDVNDTYVYTHIDIAVACAHLGRIAEARAAVATALRLRPDFTVAERVGFFPIRAPERIERIADGLRKAGMPER